MVTADDTIHATVDGFDRVIRVLDSLEEDGSSPVFAKVCEFFPGVCCTGEDVGHPGLASAGDVVFDLVAGLFFETGAENGVAEAGAVMGEYMVGEMKFGVLTRFLCL